MKTKNSLNIAALSANVQTEFGLAACTFQIAASTDTDHYPWQQILPFGQFQAYDGRPAILDIGLTHWVTTNESGSQLAEKLNAQVQKSKGLLFDYEHQTLNAKENGQPAPAAGRATEYEWRDGKGLFARTKFTDRAKEYVKGEEYQYLSPVVIWDAQGVIRDIHSVALTNDPAVDGMERISALKSNFNNHSTGDTSMNQAMQILLALLGLKAPEGADAAALCALIGENEAKVKDVEAKIKDFAALTAQVAEGKTKIAALTAQVQSGEGVDLTQFVPAATYNALLKEHATLSADHSQLSVDDMIQKAADEGALIPEAYKAHLQQLGNTKGVAALSGVLKEIPRVAALSADSQKQTEGNETENDDKSSETDTLSEEQKKMADELGVSHEEYAETLKG